MLMHVVERTLLKLSLNVMLNSLSCSFISLSKFHLFRAWRSVFLLEETGVPGESHRPVASH
jgi:hypothetical protein